jgi:ribosomal protein RSM22 (predicted rRNA methylase)
MDKAAARLLKLQCRGAAGGERFVVASGRRAGPCHAAARHSRPSRLSSSWDREPPAGGIRQSCRRFSSSAAAHVRGGNSIAPLPSSANDASAARIVVGSSIPEGGEPWKTLLEMPARAKWRVSNPQLPPAIDQARKDVYRAVPPHWKPKAKVLQRVLHDTVFERQRAMARQRDKERRVAYYDDDDNDNNARNKKRSSASDDNNNKPSSSSSQPVLLPYGPVEAMAVLQHRLHPHYAIARRVLLEARSLTLSSPHRIPIRRVIDFGMGVGSAALAALDVFGTFHSGGNNDDATAAATADGIEWVHGIDASRTMHEVSGELLRRYCHHKSQETSDASSAMMPRFTFSSHLSSSASDSASATTSSSAGSFDLALCCYTAAELTPCSASLAAAAMLWDKLAPGGILVVIEPGTPDGFANVRTIRSMLLDCCQGDDNNDEDDEDNDATHRTDELVEECHILAPCTHRGKCPMELYPPKRGKRHDQGPDARSVPEDAASDDEETAAGNADEDSDDDEDSADVTNDEHHLSSAGGTRRGYCSFVQAMPGSTGKSTRNKGEKFSYLVVQKRVTRRTTDSSDDPQYSKDLGNTPPFLDTSLTDLLRRTQQATHKSVEEHSMMIQAALDLEDSYLDSDLDPLGLELLQGDANRASFGRILHAPIKRKGHVWIDCCTGGGRNNDHEDDDGRIVRHSVSKSMSKVAPGIYSAARKSRWGGYWPTVSQASIEDEDDGASNRDDRK